MDACSAARTGHPSTASHREGCEACAHEWSQIEEMRGLAREIAYQPLTLERARAVRAGILLEVRRGRPAAKPKRWRAAAAAILVTAAASATWWWSREEESVAKQPRTITASIRSISGARPHRSSVLEGGARRELVTVTSGRIELEVAPLQPSERFIVSTRDAEVEVRGTRFEVEADQSGALMEVVVFSGLVEVRPRGRPLALLKPGERWTRPAIVEEPHPSAPVVEREPAQVQRPKRRRAVTAPRDQAPPSPPPVLPQPRAVEPTAAERAFQQGWSAYQEGRKREAMAAFTRAMSLAEGTPLAEDAAFWRERAATLE